MGGFEILSSWILFFLTDLDGLIYNVNHDDKLRNPPRTEGRKIMRQWQIENGISGYVLGVYTGETEEEALDEMAVDAGYRDYAHCQAETQSGPGELIVTEVISSPVTVSPVFLSLYCQYQGQSGPQPAYVTLSEEGVLSASYSREIGPGTPEPVWAGRASRWQIDPSLRAEAVNALLEEILPLAQRLHDRRIVRWDGRNRVGYLTPAARSTDEEIAERCLETYASPDREERYTWSEWWTSPPKMTDLEDYHSLEEAVEGLYRDSLHQADCCNATIEGSRADLAEWLSDYLDGEGWEYRDGRLVNTDV